MPYDLMERVQFNIRAASLDCEQYSTLMIAVIQGLYMGLASIGIAVLVHPMDVVCRAYFQIIVIILLVFYLEM